MYSVFVIAAIGILLTPCSATIQCKGKDGTPVDWYIIYKMPVYEKYQERRESHPVYPFPVHFYMDASTNGWVEVDRPLNESGQALYYTLDSQFYNNQSEVGYVLYSDQTLTGECPSDTVNCESQDESYGHSKGTVLFDSTSGLWLIHSTPCFPLKKSCKYGFPPNGVRYGQHFFCMSVTAANINNIGNQMRMNDPYVFESNLPLSMAEQFPNIAKLLKKDKSGLQGTTSILPMTIGSESQILVSFAKSGAFGKDLYDSLVAPHLQDGLLVETWQHGNKYNLNASCDTQYKVYDITRVKVQGKNAFRVYEDHSKYAVTSQKVWVCVGDINRQITQTKRGGGTTCLKNSVAAAAYSEMVVDHDACP